MTLKSGYDIIKTVKGKWLKMKVSFQFDMDFILKAFILYIIKESPNGLTEKEIEEKVRSFCQSIYDIM